MKVRLLISLSGSEAELVDSPSEPGQGCRVHFGALTVGSSVFGSSPDGKRKGIVDEDKRHQSVDVCRLACGSCLDGKL